MSLPFFGPAASLSATDQYYIRFHPPVKFPPFFRDFSLTHGFLKKIGVSSTLFQKPVLRLAKHKIPLLARVFIDMKENLPQ